MAVLSGIKPFEIRKNDRDFQTGDLLKLREYDPEEGKYTGSNCLVEVKYILHGPGFGLEKDYCIMGISFPQKIKIK